MNGFAALDIRPRRRYGEAKTAAAEAAAAKKNLPCFAPLFQVYTKFGTHPKPSLIACFNENIPDSVIKAIAKRQPLRAVFRDSSFADSPAKINVTEIFKLLAPHTTVKVI